MESGKIEANILTNLIEREFDEINSQTPGEKIIEFYEKASVDYLHWSENFNMHLGFYRRGLKFWRRESLLEQMNLEIAERLRISPAKDSFLIDLGCGAGAVSRTIAKIFSSAIIKGVTVSPLQIEIANRLNESENLSRRIEIIEADYADLPFENASADGVWAAESACYADGANKENLIREMARVLKPGGRFAVADCFVKQSAKKFDFLTGKIYRTVCQCWALTEFAALEDFIVALEKYGFREIRVEDISRRVAPSLAHAPFAVTGFIFKKLLAGESLNKQSLDNLKASLLALPLGLNRAKIGYFLISGTKN